jgi:glyoxylate carboligase
MSEKKKALTVYDATYNLLRKLGLTTVFGNPGSTEQTLLKNFPSDFEYVLALQEASAVAMADSFAQATGKPVLVNLHTAAGTGNGMGTIMTAFQNKTPLIITAGQQTREMLLFEPLLTNREETTLPKPWVKWAYQKTRDRQGVYTCLWSREFPGQRLSKVSRGSGRSELCDGLSSEPPIGAVSGDAKILDRQCAPDTALR